MTAMLQEPRTDRGGKGGTMGNHQTTGSITLDVDAIAVAVVRQISPLLGTRETLSPGDMADVLGLG